MDVLIQMASKDGIWAVLFVSLFVYQLKESKQRETRLMNFIDQISKHIEGLVGKYEKMSNDIEDIKDELHMDNQKKGA